MPDYSMKTCDLGKYFSSFNHQTLLIKHYNLWGKKKIHCCINAVTATWRSGPSSSRVLQTTQQLSCPQHQSLESQSCDFSISQCPEGNVHSANVESMMNIFAAYPAGHVMDTLSIHL